MGLIDFFIAGVQKGGTTALDSYLRHHPAIQMAADKEVHFFDDETVDWSNPDYERLHYSFDWSALGVALRGEATPIYTYWPGALARIRRYNPTAKLIILLRHPSFRAWSHWRMETKRGNDLLSLAEAVSTTGRARVANAPNGVHRIFSYVERGLYSTQLYRALGLFPRQQIFFCRTDQLWADPSEVLGKIQDFLGVPRHAMPGRSYIVPVNTWSHDGMAASTRKFLDAMFAEDIRATAELARLDLLDWLNRDYSEPMKPDRDPEAGRQLGVAGWVGAVRRRRPRGSS